MDYLQNLLDSSDIPMVTAMLLGLLTAISPCPLATNITAVGFISKDISCKNRIFFNGLLYTMGRIVAYALLGAVLITLLRKGGDMFDIQKQLSQWGAMLLGPILIVVGLFMLLGHRLNLPNVGFQAGYRAERLKGAWGSLLLGVLFALAFCPTSALFYFGMLIPMAANESGGYILPVAFALATGLPVVIVAWILAYSMKSLGRFYNCMQTMQKWLNVIVACVFIIVGVFYFVNS